MDGYIGEIRGFAGNFAPRNWAYCEGQLLQISQFTALYAVIGTFFGGDGRSTMQLPNLGGRVPIGAGQSAGTSYYPLGHTSGYESVVLTQNELPSHTHTATPNLTVNGAATGNVELPCYNEGGDATSPGGNILANIGSGYMEAGEADANLAPAAASLSVQGTAQGTVTIGAAGANLPVYNVQPFTAINWIICLDGQFPSRN
ncbi:MAG: tail fiber protein [Bacteroidales bacterium]|nr:tail fiber protein [Bacteroidales bacterium]